MDFQNLRLSAIAPGTYTIKAIFDGDETYNAAETEFILVVSEHPEGTQYTVQNPDPIDNSNGTLSFTQQEVEYTKKANNTYKLQQPNNPRFINYTWSSTGGTINLQDGTFSASEAGTYTLTVTGSNGATASYTITIEEDDDSWIETETEPDTPTETDTQQEEDQDKFFLYFDRQLVYQQQNSGNAYSLQSPKWSLSQNGAVPQSILSSCYYTIDNDPTHIPVSNTQIAIPNEGHHVIYLHFTGNNEYEAHIIAYTLAVYSELESDREKLNLKFTNNYVTLEMGTSESSLVFSMDANYSDVDANDFTVTVTESGSQTTQATATLSLISHQVTVTGMEDGKSYNVQLHYDGSSRYSSATTTCTVAITGEGQQEEPVNEYRSQYVTIENIGGDQNTDPNDIRRIYNYVYFYKTYGGANASIEYSFDMINWTSKSFQYVYTPNVSEDSPAESAAYAMNRSNIGIYLPPNRKIYFRGNNLNYNGCYLVYYNNAKIYGNIMSLIDSSNFSNMTTLPSGANLGGLNGVGYGIWSIRGSADGGNYPHFTHDRSNLIIPTS